MKALILLGLFFYFQPAWTMTHHVHPEDSTSGLLLAYNNCVNGDTILIHPGEYLMDKWFIQKKVVVIGIGYPVLIARQGEGIITITSDSVTVVGLKFIGVKTNYLKEESAIRIKNCRHFTIEDNHFKDCFFAIYLERAQTGIVIGNVIKGDASTEAGSGNGIHAWYCKSISIAQNDISNHRDGIYLEFVDSSTVSGNYSHLNTRYGLHYMFSNDDSYLNNVFENNGVGVAVMFSRRIIMRDNTFSHNWGTAAYGLLLKEIYDADIEHNQFIQNTVGIFVEGSNRINYQRNTFTRNGWGIKFSGGCETNRIHDNAFLYNSMDLIVTSQINDNSFDGNYWSNYSGYDLDHDGIGDVPHFPVKLYSYILDRVPEAIVLLRSLFIDLLNYSEQVSPVFTPKEVKDHSPKMTIST